MNEAASGGQPQRLATMMSSKQLGKMMEVYIDDMVINSKEKRNHISDLKEIFEVLRKYKLKLNASKCTFRASLGKFHRHLGYEWGADCEQAFQKLKQYLASPPLLLYLAVSDCAISATLLQVKNAE